jgi:hypothetical protein
VEGVATLGKKVFPWHGNGKVYEYFKVAFVGPTEKVEWCVMILCLSSGQLQSHYAYILQWLLSKINRYFVDIKLPDRALFGQSPSQNLDESSDSFQQSLFVHGGHYRLRCCWFSHCAD